MEPDYTERERYYQAQKRVKEIKGFYEHLMVFILVSIILIGINLITSPEYFWFVWCLLGWGIGVVFHGLKAFRISPSFSKEWEERKIREIIEKEKNKKTWK
ncbi:2TM domain-containing protein [Flavobacterium sp. JLP]|uniref:2TM domain-containing protein n=1 Tax=unclassified Flavobacterium TaxID=196869 RepID=UPI0004930243|nr:MULTISPECIES: 2TM domain-containing protein [unclassified Flavobacterium]MBF4493447.1 2TM domain-containing protein [Flavobacterium sp. MR2016-29]MBF4507960.1 2TM domain-containing protein [Flavobacterium sp. JLP]